MKRALLVEALPFAAGVPATFAVAAPAEWQRGLCMLAAVVLATAYGSLRESRRWQRREAERAARAQLSAAVEGMTRMQGERVVLN